MGWRLAVLASFTGLAALGSVPVSARPVFDAVVSDESIVQRGAVWRVRGRADDNAPVVLRWAGRRHVAQPSDGRWSLELPVPADLAGPAELEVEGGETRRVLVGDVWLCSGQSNMAMTVARAADGAQIAGGADAQPLRLMKVVPPGRGHAAVQRPWQRADAAATRSFSAVCLAFGKSLQRRLGVPIGLIDASLGGTRIEAWIGPARLPAAVAGDESYRRLLPAEDRGGGDGYDKNRPSGMHAAMIAPLADVSVRGVLWYQGESNRPTAGQYAERLAWLMSDWRAQWRSERLPFVVVQLPGVGPRDAVFDPLSPPAAIRQAQAEAVARDVAAVLVTTLDLGDVDLHPPSKLPLGERAARAAERAFYVRQEPPAAVTTLAATPAGGSLAVDLKPASGCVRAGGPLEGSVYLAGADREWHPATTVRLEGTRLVARSDRVRAPVALRYAWGDQPPAPLHDCARDQPVPGLRTDDWPVTRPLR